MKSPNREFFETIYKKYNKRKFVSPDPLQFLYDYKDVKDREIVGLIASSFAYGNVKQIIKTVDKILKKLGKSPYKTITTSSKDDFEKMFKNFKYRFTTSVQLVNLLLAIQNTLKKYHSLEKCFLVEYTLNSKNVLTALKHFCKQLRGYGNINSLIPDPAKSSALKRVNLFLRWQVRQDNVDPGGWSKVRKKDLIVPVDTHMHKIAKKLCLTKRKPADMKTAIEITRNFAKLNIGDPVKYDFCLTRFGIREEMSIDSI